MTTEFNIFEVRKYLPHLAQRSDKSFVLSAKRTIGQINLKDVDIVALALLLEFQGKLDSAFHLPKISGCQAS